MNIEANPKLAENIAKAERHLARFRGQVLPHFIAADMQIRIGKQLTPLGDQATDKLPGRRAADIQHRREHTKTALRRQRF